MRRLLLVVLFFCGTSLACIESNFSATPIMITPVVQTSLPSGFATVASTLSENSDSLCIPQNAAAPGSEPVVGSLEVQPGTRVAGMSNEIRYLITSKSINIVAKGLQNVAELRICWAAIGAGGDPLHFLGKATISGSQASLSWLAPDNFKSITFWPIAVNANDQSTFGPGITVVGP